jgi:hypothetical protein
MMNAGVALRLRLPATVQRHYYALVSISWSDGGRSDGWMEQLDRDRQL